MIQIAWAALWLWPVAAVVFYRMLPLPMALIATLMGGYLLLPSAIEIDVPLLPPLNKTSIPTITALVLTALAAARPNLGGLALRGWFPRTVLIALMPFVLLIGMVGTVMTNGDPLYYGPRVLRGIQPYDVLSEFLRTVILITPFFLARKVMATQDSHRMLLMALSVSAVIYCFPSLWEVRMSPQLHSQIYGIFPHSFIQHMRGGGFRPLVFLPHVLSLSIFLACAMIATAILFRYSQEASRSRYILALMLLFFTLLMAKAFGAFLIACLFVPIAFFLGPRIQLMIATCIAVIVITYPVLRSADMVPVDRIMSFAESVDEERAASLGTRLQNEERLIAKAKERPWFGWGGWGRSRVYTDWGKDITLTDGAWIVELGAGGWFKYVAIFGLLCFPIIGLFLKRRTCSDPFSIALALILSAKLVDLLPNSDIAPIYFMMAGALTGRLEVRQDATISPDTQTVAADPPRRAGYARPSDATAAQARTQGPRYARDFASAPPAKKTTVAPDRVANNYSRRSKSGYRR